MKKKLEILFITLCTSSAFFLNVEGIYKNQISAANIFTQDLFVVTFVFFLLAGWYHKYQQGKITKSKTVLAIIFSFFMFESYQFSRNKSTQFQELFKINLLV